MPKAKVTLTTQPAQGSLAVRIRLAAFGLAIALLLAFGSVAILTQMEHAQKNQYSHHSATLALLSNTLRLNLEARLDILNGLSSTPMLWTAISDAYSRDNYLKPFLDNYNNTHAESMPISLFDYRGRWIAGEHDQLAAHEGIIGALLQKTIASQRPEALHIAGSSPRLLLAYPVHSPYTSDTIGILLSNISLDAMIRSNLLQLDDRLGYVVRLDDAVLFASIPCVEPRYQPVTADISPADSPALFHIEIELFGLHSTTQRVLARQGALFTLTGLILTLGIWWVSGLLARYLAQRLRRLADAVGASPRPHAESIPQDEGNDEISLLARVLKQALSEHEQMTGQLEELVKARTQELTASEERYQLVIEGGQDGIWDWNIATGELYLSPRWKEIIGYTDDELPNHFDTFAEHLHPDDKARVQDAFDAHLRGHTPLYRLEFRFRHKDGSWRWIHSRGIMLRDAEGKPYRMAGSHTDITERRKDEETLRTLYTAIEQAPATVVIANLDACIEYVNPRFTQVTGYTLEEVRGQNTRILQSGHTSKESYQQMWDTLTHGRVWQGELENKRKNGELYWEDIQIAPVKDAAGATLHYVAVNIDVTEAKRNADSLRLAASVFTHAHEGIIITDAETRIIDVNATFTQITGYTRAEVLGKNPHFLSSGQQDAEFYEAMWRKIRETDFWQGEVWNRRKDGSLYAEWLSISSIRDSRDQLTNYLAMFSDITEQKEHQRYIEHIAHHDALTGLPNRVLLLDRLTQSMALALRHERPLAVAYLDLDGFKAINDSHGHSMGDKLLIQISNRMKLVVRDGDTVARIGGDEFVAVMQDLDEINSSVPLVLRLLSAASKPVETDGLILRVSASIGVTYFPQQDDVEADQLVRQADQAMYQAKQAGKNRYHVFDAEQDRSVRGHHARLTRLQEAMTRQEFKLYYQPKANMRSGEVIGAEALLRWQDPQSGLLEPADFLETIEGNPLAIELGEWVIDTALAQISAWQEQGLYIAVSVNVGARQLQHKDFISRLRQIMARYPEVSPESLELEVLESSALEDLGLVSSVINACREFGIEFALDDFGTGYSSLTYLKHLPAKTLKIDQSFVHDMLGDSEDLAIVEGVLSLADAFHRQVIAEGVETRAHGTMLLRLGCEHAQGYAIARPMPADEMIDWMANWHPYPEWVSVQKMRREDLHILYAIAEHQAWVSAVIRQLQDKPGKAPCLDDCACRLEKWLHTEAHRNLAFQDSLLKLESLHKSIHALGANLLHLKFQGQAAKALAQMDTFIKQSDSLLEQLWALEQRWRSGD